MITEREQILALAGEPVGYVNSQPKHPDDWFSLSSMGDSWNPVFTADQVIAARKPLEEQLELYAAENSSLRAAGFENAQDLFTSYQGLEKQLAAVQLQIQQYREALSGLLQDDGAIAFFAPMNVAKAYAALALPADTALEAIVEKAGEVMRERSATVCDKRSTYYGRASAESQEAKDCAFNIRALPPVKLDDLK